ncbi:MAG: hypothetical protein M1538_02885 [Candidatus Marsarchaeota archaeon]|nr:hypothetical protein [Candidatus Marsarchaeota archaeon]
MENKNNNKNKHGKKSAQSAVDYLMTYGWAILIIVAVILILFKLGVFSSGSLTGSACVGTPGFLCTIPTMNSSGYLSASIGSATESIDILAVGCSASDSAPPSTNFTYLSKSIKLPPQSSVIQLFHCPLPANSPLGTPFTGTLWIKYNTQYVSSQVSEVGSLVAKVDTVGSLSYTGSKILPTSFYLTMGIIPNNGGIVTPGSGSYNTATTVSISATPNSGYIFDGWLGSGSGNYNGTSNTATVTMNGNITETATFIKPNTILFVDPGLPFGTSWGVTFNGVTNSTTGNFVSFTENTPGNYPYYVDYVSSYAPTVLNSTVDFVNYNVIDVNFSKVYHIAPYQQLVTFSPTSYSTYESSDLGNIRFYYKSIQTYNNITELNSWCESGCSSSASQARFLVLLPNDVNVTEPNGNITSANIILDMYFSNTPQYSGVHAGEAPQLSSTYGEYDNGGRVFNYYTNFAGNALPTNWASAGGANYIVNDGITIYPGGTNDGTIPDHCTGGVFDTQGFSSNNYMEDFYGNVIGSTISATPCDTAGVGIVNTSSPFPTSGVQATKNFLWLSSNINPIISSVTSFGGGITTNYASGQNNVFTSIVFNCLNNSYLSGAVNYNINSTNPLLLSEQINPYYPFMHSQDNTTLTLNIKWLGFRSFPPIGIAPPITIGSIQSSSNGNYLPIGISMKQNYYVCHNNGTINTTYQFYQLIMKASPTGGGTTIPSVGSHLLSGGGGVIDEVEIDAVTNPGYVFYGWSGTGSGSYTGTDNPATINMSGDINETAVFTPAYYITFTENGLANVTNTLWYVTVNGITKSSSTNTITFMETNGIYSYTINAIVGPSPATGSIPYPHNGSLTVAGANIIKLISFGTYYPITFEESGLPSGAYWSAYINQSFGNYYPSNFGFANSTSSTLTLRQIPGSHRFYIPTTSGSCSTSANVVSCYTYVPSPGSSNITITNTAATQSIVFSNTLWYVYNGIANTITYSNVPMINYTESGLSSNTAWGIDQYYSGTYASGQEYEGGNPELNYLNMLESAGGTYNYYVMPSTPGYIPSPTSGSATQTSTTTPLSVPISYTAGNTYSLSFTENGLASGTSWFITSNNVLPTSKSNGGATESYILPAGSYTYNVSIAEEVISGIEYACYPSESSNTISISSNTVIPITYVCNAAKT